MKYFGTKTHQPNNWLMRIFPGTKSQIRQVPCVAQKSAREFLHGFDFRLKSVPSTTLQCQCDIQIVLENCLETS